MNVICISFLPKPDKKGRTSLSIYPANRYKYKAWREKENTEEMRARAISLRISIDCQRKRLWSIVVACCCYYLSPLRCLESGKSSMHIYSYFNWLTQFQSAEKKKRHNGRRPGANVKRPTHHWHHSYHLTRSEWEKEDIVLLRKFNWERGIENYEVDGEFPRRVLSAIIVHNW